MKRFVVIMGLLGIVLCAFGQETIYGKLPGVVPRVIEESSSAQNYMSMLPAEDTFATYIYTFGDVIIFSYEDSASAEIVNQSGTVIWSGNLDEDEYVFRQTGEGIFEVRCNKEFSVLIGDPMRIDCQGWLAVDRNTRPLSNKFLTFIQGALTGGSYSGREVFCVFAYYDSTNVTVTDLNDGSEMWSGTLDALEFWEKRNPAPTGTPVSVVSDKSVSALSYTDCGYYAPAFNGTFTGRDFITYNGNMGGWSQSLKVIPWEDSTNVVVTDLKTSSDTLWKVFIQNHGDVQGQDFLGRFIKVHADKDISCAMVPGGNPQYYHLVRSIDRDGLGIGTEFYIPTYQTGSLIAKLDIFAFYDGTEVKVYQMPNENTPVWSGTLDAGGHHRVQTSYGTYKVESSEGVAIIESHGDLAGGDFLPLWFAIHPEIAATPDQFQETECLVPVSQTTQGYYEVDVENNGNIWDVVNIFTTNSRAPDFTTELFDELGGVLPDVDGDGNPDSDTLAKGASVLVLADVTPVNNVPFGTADTCFFEIVSVRDAEKRDTALLVTRIRPVAIGLPDTVRTTGYPGEYATLDVYATSTSHYRDDTVNLSWTATKPEATWEVRVFDAVTGFELDDNDGDGSPDVPDVAVNEEQEPFGVQVFIPDTAIAGDEDTIFLVGHSANYPFADYPTVEAISVLIVTVEPAPAILIRPDTTDSVPSGHAIYYPLEVLNYGNGPDVPEITFTVTQSGWSHRVLDKDLNDLPDTDTDGTPDAGTIPGLIAGEPGLDTIYLEVRPPYSALSGVMDSTVVLATSSVADTVWDIATVRTITRAIVSLDIDPDTTMIIGVGDTAVYDLRVTNNGGAVDTVAVGSYALPDLGWSYAFTFADSSALTDSNGDGDLDMGAVDSATTEILRLLVIPHEDLGKIMGEFDTTVTEIRYVWIRTVFTDDMELVNDSVQIVTVFEPELNIHNYPNPFSGQEGTTFAFTIPRAGIVTLRIYNRAGEHIVTLLEDEHYGLGGVFRQYWNGLTTSGNRPAPGVYLYTLEWKADEASGLIKTKRITKKALLQP